MRLYRSHRTKQGGQALALFALMLTVMLLGAGLVIDGGVALASRRASQNASDLAALAGARVVAEWLGGDTVNGTDANVKSAITTTVASNGGSPVAFGISGSPQYVGSDGSLLGLVGSGTIPADSSGVTVNSSRSWHPFLLSLAGFTDWSAGADATALGGFAVNVTGNGVFPLGVAEDAVDSSPLCSGEVGSSTDCQPVHMTSGQLNAPGAFGWLKFGCDGFGLGQVPPANDGGCKNSKTFLQDEIGPPSKSYGCCTAVGLPASPDKIGNNPGNKASADCSYYIDNDEIVTVPVWDVAGGNGSNAWYHIVGFAGFQLTKCSGAKDVEGVFRQQFFLGPTTTTKSFEGQALAVQLVR